eukprot:GEMP01035979.1.p1 GENE.GEMP01035979.1~~GEMP01035979.1.p1  ORF type:complete len:235 (-),score=75.97 GEMP01035979.1:1197-1901(-)
MAHKFTVEYSKSNRATCKGCKAKIGKDDVRVGYSQEVSDEVEMDDKQKHIMMGPKWYHFGCFDKLKGVRWFKENLCPAVDVVGYGALQSKDKKDLDDLFDLLRSGKRLAETSSEALQKLTKNQGVLSDDLYAKIEYFKTEWVKKSVAQLQAMLQKNNMAKSGPKAELLERAAEARVLGVLPPCQTCNIGKLKWNRADDSLSCPGYFDDVSGHMKRCKGPAKDEEVTRLRWEDLL